MPEVSRNSLICHKRGLVAADKGGERSNNQLTPYNHGKKWLVLHLSLYFSHTIFITGLVRYAMSEMSDSGRLSTQYLGSEHNFFLYYWKLYFDLNYCHQAALFRS